VVSAVRAFRLGTRGTHHLVGAQHHRQPARLAGTGDPLRDLRQAERHPVEEPQRRHRLVQARPSHALRRQVNLKGPHVLQRQRAGRAAEEPAELRYGMKAGRIAASPARGCDRHVFGLISAIGGSCPEGVSATQSFQSGAPTATPLPYRGAVSFNHSISAEEGRLNDLVGGGGPIVSRMAERRFGVRSRPATARYLPERGAHPAEPISAPSACPQPQGRPHLQLRLLNAWSGRPRRARWASRNPLILNENLEQRRDWWSQGGSNP
jgi:hypothetical protein